MYTKGVAESDCDVVDGVDLRESKTEMAAEGRKTESQSRLILRAGGIQPLVPESLFIDSYVGLALE